MRIALCLPGIVGASNFGMGLGTDIDPRLGHHFHNKNIFEHNDVDVFIHSWSIEHEKLLLDLYNPKGYIIEPQVNFGQSTIRDNSIASRWYSTAMVVNLKSEYEQEHGFEYDWVMVYRFDHVFFVPLNFEKFDNQYVYFRHTKPHGWVDGVRAPEFQSRDWTDTTCDCHTKKWMDHFKAERLRLYDAFFFSSSANVNKLAGVYEHMTISDVLHSPHDEIYSQLQRSGLANAIKFEFFQETETEALRAYFKNPEYIPENKFDISNFERFEEEYVRQNKEVQSRFRLVDADQSKLDKSKSGFNDMPIQ